MEPSSSPGIVTTCATVDCGRPASRHHRWRRWVRVERVGPRGGRRWEWAAEGELVEADYCEGCSANLRMHADEVEPPWPEATVTPIRRDPLDG
jgi:hypothetical protein